MVTPVDDMVPVQPLQDAYVRVIQAGLYTESEVAMSLGWGVGRGKGDTTRLQRKLGLYPRRDTARSYATEIPYYLAVTIARVIGVAPMDVDL